MRKSASSKAPSARNTRPIAHAPASAFSPAFTECPRLPLRGEDQNFAAERAKFGLGAFVARIPSLSKGVQTGFSHRLPGSPPEASGRKFRSVMKRVLVAVAALGLLVPTLTFAADNGRG